MLVRFWGTRGSIASPGPATARYGGNTSCVEVRSGESLAILDCGTGARALGAALAAERRPLRTHLLLSHIHWDHIQGFPFFLPAFLPDAEMDVYGAAGLEQGLEEALAGQMQYTYFPVRLGDLSSHLRFHEVAETSFSAGALNVRSQFLNHTCPTVGYRLCAGGRSVAYMTDHEPYWLPDPTLPLSDWMPHPGNQRHIDFVRGVDLLIHDAQYTAEEYPARRGWGHSTIEHVVDVAIKAGVRRLALFHHEPTRDDDQLDRLVEGARERARQRGGEGLEVFAASEGQTIELSERETVAEDAPARPSAYMPLPARVALHAPPLVRRSLRGALVDDGHRFSESEPGQPLFDPRIGVPDVVVVAPCTERAAEEQVADAWRQADGIPLVAVVDSALNAEVVRRIAQLAADVVVTPFSMPNLRARVRAVLVRRRARPGAAERIRQANLASLQMVDRLPSSELEWMLEAGEPCSFRPGETVFSQGDPPGGVYYLHDGLLRIFTSNGVGREITVGFAGAGDTVGEMSAVDDATRSATVVALRPVRATYVSREAFRRALERSPETAVRVLRLLVRRLREADRQLTAQAHTSDVLSEWTPAVALHV